MLWPAHWAVLVPLVVTAGCELLRRTRPRAALLIGTAAVVADTVTLGSVVTVVMFTDLMYAAVLYGTPASARRLPWLTGLLTVIGGVGPAAVWGDPDGLLIGVGVGVVAFAPAATGSVVRNHREAAEAARLRAEQTALLAEMDRSQAVTAERARMARELHDMVANHLSAIAIHSTAALSIDEPGTSREALGVIRENSVAGLAEMRRLIGILRDGDGEGEPVATPTLDGLAALVDGARTNGLDVTLDADPGRVPAPVELAAYRIVQESLTNALKHASPGRVAVTLAARDGSLAVRVTSPYGDRDGPRAPGSGPAWSGCGNASPCCTERSRRAPRTPAGARSGPYAPPFRSPMEEPNDPRARRRGPVRRTGRARPHPAQRARHRRGRRGRGRRAGGRARP
ncbi:two-component sensor histidine kinase [Streptomyces avermitilis]|uniref:histidine kinase n=1 Tax=Streptomyces avermitilis TaxID=33903 RepID=A0A4D4MZR1_STRAX|nr:two-component sensor histidine kinase [Streptomyces avermitilis]